MMDFASMTVNEIKKIIESSDTIQKSWVRKLIQDRRTSVHKLGLILQKRVKAEQAEAVRVESMWEYERRLWGEGIQRIAGVDEAGRGPLAGPVVAAAVILPGDFDASGLNDSKQLTEEQRETLRDRIIAGAVAIGVGVIEVDYIDRHNIYQATLEAMGQAIAKLDPAPEILLLDAVKLPGVEQEQWSIIKGDALSHSIAAASVIAKTTRDRIMKEYAIQYPEYGFEDHKGYSSPAHFKALDIYGPSPIHRRSFRPVAERLEEDLFTWVHKKV